MERSGSSDVQAQTADEQLGRLESSLEKVATPFVEFVNSQQSGSMVLILCTFAALLVANVVPGGWYEQAAETPVGLILGDVTAMSSLKHVVNDGLMAIFFFVLGLEIKREFMAGHLKDPGARNLIIMASLGGMFFPAGLYALANIGSETGMSGWGVPMATDTAFAIGILAMLGKRAPSALFAFLVAYAIIDDIGAILIIALFYSADIQAQYLWMTLGLLALLQLLNFAGIRRAWPYMLLGLLVWLALLNSGVHATLAGILVAMTVPARPRHSSSWLVMQIKRMEQRLNRLKVHRTPVLADQEQHELLHKMEQTTRLSMTPLQRWEHNLDGPVSFLIMPVFALLNAGVIVNLDAFQQMFSNSVGYGIILGLVVGKPLGIFLMSWLVLSLGAGRMPEGLCMKQILGLGLLGGIGFTMSIFISNLAFGFSPELINTAKLAILLSSLLAATMAFILLKSTVRRQV